MGNEESEAPNKGLQSGLQRKNLIPFEPGKSGNPKGGSKKATFKRLFKEWVKDGDVEAVYKTLSKKAKAGKDFRFVSEFMERVEGKVVSKSELTGANGKDLIDEIIIKVVKPDA